MATLKPDCDFSNIVAAIVAMPKTAICCPMVITFPCVKKRGFTNVEFIQGDIISWEREGCSLDGEKENGKQSYMLRFTIKINTDKDNYEIFVIDYNRDTIAPDNEGVYMLELSKSSYDGEWDYWQNRMCAGISIVE